MNRKTRSHRHKSSYGKPLSISVQTDYKRVIIIAGVIGVLLLLLLFLGKRLGSRFLYTNDALTPTPFFVSSPTPQPDGENGLPNSVPSETPTPEAPSPTPTPALILADYDVQILNGNGIAGSASEAQNIIEAKGLNVESTANASRWDYGSSEIRGAEGVPQEVLNIVSTALEGIYVTEIKESSVNTNGYDVLVVLGRDKK